ncbi:hypothetical protein G6F35_014811 [Rhizopus arrhizus]|nr:hypothetical protein G6F35_014811 [Rhizopus arrhizus]KAG1243324.1 hypothetical protein G6F65_022475 [Rhizopus arrhizus]
MRPERIAVQGPAQQFDHHGKAIALVAVALAAQGAQRTDVIRVDAIMPLRIHRHAGRQRHAVAPGVHDAVPGDGRGGHIQA